MRAMVLERQGERLVPRRVGVPRPGPGEILIRVAACAVCRTDLHILDGELPHPRLPLIPGHQIVGRVEELGPNVASVGVGDRVGVPWLGWTCGQCRFCESGRENLCDRARFTGYDVDGGFAEFAAADSRFAFRIPENYDEVEAAPFLCAGLIGYRAYRFLGDARRVGFYGFGSAAHLLIQIAVAQGREVVAFTRKGDLASQAFARSLGAVWAGASGEMPPELLDGAIIFAPVGGLVPEALRAIDKGGTVVCAGIHMSDIPQFPYADLWGERSIRSVANLTRADGEELFATLRTLGVKTEVTRFALEEANEALDALRRGEFQGSVVLVPER
jgi:propanol-preferring alcohol dehydrogenase